MEGGPLSDLLQSSKEGRNLLIVCKGVKERGGRKSFIPKDLNTPTGEEKEEKES